MSNNILAYCLNKTCIITTALAVHHKVTVTNIEENWIIVEQKGKKELINSDYIQSIKILE